MCSLEHLDGLRRQNKELLQKLKHRPENLHFQCLRIESENKTPETGKSADNSARDRTSLTEKHKELACGCWTAEEAQCVSEDTVCDVLLPERVNDRLRVPVNPTSQTKLWARVMEGVGFPHEDDESECGSESERPRVQPLLGYDWIAGLLDAESSLAERSEQFFRELRTFRQVNSEECIHSITSRLPDATAPWPLPLDDGVTNPDRAPDSHQCTFCYRINSRLFAAPLDPRAACPVCRTPKEDHPHTENQPAFIRVSIPCATLLPAYRYKAHRRCSFDPSDSLDLPSHCLSGWTNISMGVSSSMSSLDLRNSTEIRPNPGTLPSAQDESRTDVAASRASGRQSSDRLPELSRLARCQFQHGARIRTKPFNVRRTLQSFI